MGGNHKKIKSSSANRTGFKDTKKALDALERISKKIDNTKDIMSDLKDVVDACMKGDGGYAYWDGPEALDWYNHMKSNMDLDIKAYRNNVGQLADFKNALTVDARDNKKTLTKVLGLRVPGVNDADDCKITISTSTIHADGTTKDYTAMKDALDKIKVCLDALKKSFNELGNLWDEVGKYAWPKTKNVALKRGKWARSKATKIGKVKSELPDVKVLKMMKATFDAWVAAFKKQWDEEHPPAGNTGNQPAGNTGDQTAGNAGGQTAGNTGDQTAGNTGDQTAGNAGDQTAGNTGDQTAGNTGDQTAGNTGDKTSENV